MTELTKFQKVMLNRGDILPPDTKAIYNQYKEPLRKVEKGFGYMGTIAFDESEQFTQCHICGFFFKRLGRHITNQHEMEVKEYRVKFGLAMQSSLVATKTRKAYLDRFEKLTADEKLKKVMALTTASLETRMTLPPRPPYSLSLEQKNKEGRCPDQLLDKIEVLANTLERTPTYREFGKEYGGGYAQSVVSTYGSWLNALKILGLTPQKTGTGYRYDERKIKFLFWDFVERYGREPYTSDLTLNKLGISNAPITRIFGSFTRAKDIAFARAKP